MKSPGLHRFAVLVAVGMFLLIGVGAYLTSNIRPLPGTNPGPVVAAPELNRIHTLLAVVVALFTIGLALWVRSIAGWIALATVIIEGGLGSFAAIPHAIVAPILFASLVAVALQTSETWSKPPVPAGDVWPPLRTMAITTPLLVILQITLGAAFRHNLLGVIWHILDAGIVLLLIMILGVCVLRQFPEHPALRPAAIWMLVITGVQVLLGFTVYLTILIVSQNNGFLIWSGVLHVLTGSLTLAATVVMWLELMRADVTDRSMTAGNR